MIKLRDLIMLIDMDNRIDLDGDVNLDWFNPNNSAMMQKYGDMIVISLNSYDYNWDYTVYTLTVKYN